MQASVMFTAFLLPGALVVYWVVADWAKDRAVRKRWVSQPLLSEAMKQSTAPIGRRTKRVVNE
jgi:hypothetical protein